MVTGESGGALGLDMVLLECRLISEWLQPKIEVGWVQVVLSVADLGPIVGREVDRKVADGQSACSVDADPAGDRRNRKL